MDLEKVDMFGDLHLVDLATTVASLFGGFEAAGTIGCSKSSTEHCSAMIGRGQRWHLMYSMVKLHHSRRQPWQLSTTAALQMQGQPRQMVDIMLMDATILECCQRAAWLWRVGYSIDMSCNLGNSSHFNAHDASQGYSVWTEEHRGIARNWFFIMPNVHGRKLDGSSFAGVAIKLHHGTAISWDGRVVRHCTSITMPDGVDGGSPLVCKWSSCDDERR